MKWTKFKKALPPADTVVIVHIRDYEYIVGSIAAISMDCLDKFCIIPHDDSGYSVEVNRCIAWAVFKNRSPWEGD